MTEDEWLACSDLSQVLSRVLDRASARKVRLFGVACLRRALDTAPLPHTLRAVAVSERMADEPREGDDHGPLLTALLYEGVSSEAEHWRKRDCLVRRHLAHAAYHALQTDAAYRAGERLPALDGDMEEWRYEIVQFALHEEWREAGCAVPALFDRPDLIRPDLTQVWCETARAVARRNQPEDGSVLNESDYLRAACEQMPLAQDIFGLLPRHDSFAPAWRTRTAEALASTMYESRDFGPMPILADALEEAGCDDPDILNHCRQDGVHMKGCWVVDSVLGKS